MLKDILKQHLSEWQITLLQNVYITTWHWLNCLLQWNRQILRQGKRWVFPLWYHRNLPKLATYYGTDKWGEHWYALHYQKHFAPLRRKALNILEIGIGGYDHAHEGGESLRMWKRYFSKSRIYGIDLYDKTAIEESRITTFCGSQADPQFLRRVVDDIGRIDIIIDDGSHQNEHVRTAFETLFPYLSQHGMYVIEDTQASYWPEFGGKAPGQETSETTIAFLKTLIDGLNYEEFKPEIGMPPTYFDQHIVALHFYHNLVFIYKGFNNEGSNSANVREKQRKQQKAIHGRIDEQCTFY